MLQHAHTGCTAPFQGFVSCHNLPWNGGAGDMAHTECHLHAPHCCSRMHWHWAYSHRVITCPGSCRSVVCGPRFG